MDAANVFEQMLKEFQPEKAGNLHARFQFNLSGDGGGNWSVAVANRTCTVTQGVVPKPDVTVNMGASDFVKMVNGELQPVVAFMQGKLKLQGDMTMAMKVQELFAGAGPGQ
jgi:putative sterol carrier protein